MLTYKTYPSCYNITIHADMSFDSLYIIFRLTLPNSHWKKFVIEVSLSVIYDVRGKNIKDRRKI